jgi:hypothetical protein
MKKALMFLVASACLFAQGPFKPVTAGRITRGAGAPAAGQCAAATDVGKVYVRSDAAAPASSLYVCAKTAAATYAWDLGSGNGTGGTSCENAGASPSATASANVTAINACLAAGGRVSLSTPGTYSINNTLIIGSNTTLVLGPAVTIFQAASTNKNMLVNSAYNTFSTTTSVTLGTPTGMSVPVTWTAHGFSVGQYVLISGASPSNYNGVFRVATVTDANTFTYLMDRLPSNGLATATYSSGGSFSGTGNCSLASFNNGNVGGTATIAVSSGTPGAITIVTTGYNSTAAPTSATATSGTATCSGTPVLTGGTLQEAIGSGTVVGKLCDVNIRVEGGIWDGNSANNSAATLGDVAVIFGAVENASFRNAVMQNSGKYLLNFGAVRDYVIENITVPTTPNDVVKISGPAYNGYIHNLSGLAADDAFSFEARCAVAFATYSWTFGDIIMGTVDGVYVSHTAAANGNETVLYTSATEYMGSIKISNVGGTTPGHVAALITATFASSTLNDVEFDNIDSASADILQIYGSGSGTITVGSIDVHHLVLNPPLFTLPATASVYLDNTATINKLSIDDAVLVNGNFTSAGGYFAIIGGTVNEINFSNWLLKASTNMTALVNLNSTAVVNKLNVDRVTQTVAASGFVVISASATVGHVSITNSNINTQAILTTSAAVNASIQNNRITGATNAVLRTVGSIAITAELGGNLYSGGSVRLAVTSGSPTLLLKDNDPVLGTLDFGTVPTITGCGTISAQTGGTTAGTFTTTTTGTCAAAFALPTALNGWACYVQDITKHVAANIMMQSVSSASSCTVTGTTAASDVLTFNAIPY